MARRLTTILELLRSTKSKVGKTFIQKAIFVLQEWLGWESDYRFKLHYYGPYSSMLSEDLDSLIELGLVEAPFDGNSYGITISEQGLRFLDEHLESHMLNKTKIERAVSLIGTGGVKNMELIGTILYFARIADEGEIADLVNTVKPHFSEDEIGNSIQYLKEQGIL